jgi:hypothetical protein
MCRRAVNMLSLVLNLAKFLTNHPRPVLEPLSTGQALSVKLRVVPHLWCAIPSLFIERP